MSDEEPDTEEEPAKKSKKPMLIGLILALLGGGGGFYATWSGMILGGESHAEEEHAEEEMPAAPTTAFVPVEQLVISLNNASRARHLVFRAELEVPQNHAEEVQTLLPRVVDVLNSYLRALDPSDLEDSSALTRLRAQMLRRVQTVVGQGRVSDLLVMEFVLN